MEQVRNAEELLTELRELRSDLTDESMRLKTLAVERDKAHDVFRAAEARVTDSEAHLQALRDRIGEIAGEAEQLRAAFEAELSQLRVDFEKTESAIGAELEKAGDQE